MAAAAAVAIAPVAAGVSRRTMVRAAGVGLAAGCMGTWFEMSHGVVCIPVMTLPPLQLGQQVAVGTTVFGVAVRQLISATLYAADPSTDIDDVESLSRIMDVQAGVVLAVSGTFSALSTATLASRLASKHVRRANGLFLVALALFLQWRESKILVSEAQKSDGQLEDDDEPAEVLEPGTSGPAFVAQRFPEPEAEGAIVAHPVSPASPMGDLPRLISLGALAGASLGFFGIGPAWMLAPILSHTAQAGAIGSQAVEASVGPQLSGALELGAFASDERTRTTACIAMVPPSVAAAFRHWSLGNVPHMGGIAIPLAAGAIVGSAVSGQQLADVPCDADFKYGMSILLFSYGCWLFLGPIVA
mmetsp:Transcript_67648/g.175687  ORF Transcript_67648/g.175687 Transcript_67648/m.175687 type:complete len:359 (-) Transcript_67648:95-1171(-)